MLHTFKKKSETNDEMTIIEINFKSNLNTNDYATVHHTWHVFYESKY